MNIFLRTAVAIILIVALPIMGAASLLYLADVLSLEKSLVYVGVEFKVNIGACIGLLLALGIIAKSLRKQDNHYLP